MSIQVAKLSLTKPNYKGFETFLEKKNLVL